MTTRPRTLSIVLFAGLALAVATPLLTPEKADAHCQVPCGIYGDELKFEELAQHVATVEKAMAQITELTGKSDAQSAQQLARWVANKESHATKIQAEAQEYFLAQRIKFPEDESEHEAYFAKLKSLHEIIVYAMKCKQTVDTTHVESLKASLETFKHQYFGKDAHAAHDHDHDHHDHEGHTH
ncbi:MAG: superoxide dismutase [Ni] [Planctomycetota bacterium]